MHRDAGTIETEVKDSKTFRATEDKARSIGTFRSESDRTICPPTTFMVPVGLRLALIGQQGVDRLIKTVGATSPRGSQALRIPDPKHRVHANHSVRVAVVGIISAATSAKACCKH